MQALRIRTGTTATRQQRAAVAELMATAENPVGRSSLTMPRGLYILLLAPAEPVDEPDEE